MNRIVVVALLASCGSSPPKAVEAPPVAQPEPPAPPPVEKPASIIPDTPAGKTLAAWLDAFNSADAVKMKAFAEQYKAPPQYVDAGFREGTGGFELVSIDKSEPTFVRFVVKEKVSPMTAVGWLRVKDGSPIEVDSMRLRAIPEGMTAKDMEGTVDQATRDRVIDAAIAKLNEYYVFPDVAKKMETELRQRQRQAAYDTQDAQTFATLLTDHLRGVSNDKHLMVVWTPKALPETEVKQAPDKAKMQQQLEKMNCMFSKTETLDGNIGYLKFDAFADPTICGPKASEAFAALADVKSLIIDLRENGGGDPAMVAYVSSYLFAKKTHLNDLYDRKENKTTQYWTKTDVPGTKLAKQPVFVLTSKNTFSGAEEFAYNLKSLKRAKIIGETTGGGAHPTTMKRLDAHFAIGVPFARAINPITKKNWEGTGVEPDVKVPAAEALDKAKELAAAKR
jgi:hypothetical protein